MYYIYLTYIHELLKARWHDLIRCNKNNSKLVLKSGVAQNHLGNVLVPSQSY